MQTKPTDKRLKAETYFAWYYMLGGDRSLVKLHGFVCDLGVKITLKTLERYSKEYEWQKRVEELDSNLIENNREKLLNTVDEMNMAHLHLASQMRNLALSSVKQGIDIMNRDGSMRGSDIAKLARETVNIERLALGEATERIELARSLTHILVIEIGNLFKKVNDLTDPQDRLQKFAEGSDQIINGHLKMLE